MRKKASHKFVGLMVILLIIVFFLRHGDWAWSLLIIFVLFTVPGIYRTYWRKLASRKSNKYSGEKPIGKKFQFLICDNRSEVEPDRWYHLQRWESPNFLKMDTTWTKEWKRFATEVNVVGVTHDDREANFLIMGDQSDFKIFLEREPDNPVDPNAIKVMGSATVDGAEMIGQLGYLPKEIAQQLSNEKGIDARPHSVFLPYEDKRYGLIINILVRSANYKKKNHKP